MSVFSDVPAAPAEAAGCLWCPLPLSTGLIASVGAIKGKRREDNAMQLKAKHGRRKTAHSSQQVQNNTKENQL